MLIPGVLVCLAGLVVLLGPTPRWGLWGLLACNLGIALVWWLQGFWLLALAQIVLIGGLCPVLLLGVKGVKP